MKYSLILCRLRVTIALPLLWLLAACASSPGHMTQINPAHHYMGYQEEQNAEDADAMMDAAEDEQPAAPPVHHSQYKQADESFDLADIADDQQLASMRGGFLYAGGLTINFGLTSSTSINGIIQSSLQLSTSNLNGMLPSSLQQLIQTGNGNQKPSPAITSPQTLSSVSNSVMTIVQNTANNQVIQNQNILNITVQNLHNFSTQVNLANQHIPMVLSLH